ncbi:MAG: DUF4198 domain-containing protein [Lacibacter sp.]
MNYKALTLLLCCLFVVPLLAHEFWLQPQKFLFSAGEEINIRFNVGEHFTGNNWKGSRQKINELKLYYADVTDDLSDALTDDEGDSLQFSIFEEGTVMIAFNSTNSFIQLNAKEFNNYLKEDGLYEADEYRKQHSETDSSAKELYQRSVKTIIQVGNRKTEVYKKQTSLPLDIIPLINPYTISANQKIPVRVLFMGKPLANAKVRTWHRISTEIKDSSFITNEKGETSFSVNANGEWMVSCVHMIRLGNNSDAQWQSYWGSVTWGYTGYAGTRLTSR